MRDHKYAFQEWAIAVVADAYESDELDDIPLEADVREWFRRWAIMPNLTTDAEGNDAPLIHHESFDTWWDEHKNTHLEAFNIVWNMACELNERRTR